MGETAFADYDGGLEMPMPEWFDDDFVEAIVDVAAHLPDHRQYNYRPVSKAQDLARHLRTVPAR